MLHTIDLLQSATDKKFELKVVNYQKGKTSTVSGSLLLSMTNSIQHTNSIWEGMLSISMQKAFMFKGYLGLGHSSKHANNTAKDFIFCMDANLISSPR